jgi:UDPglucose 6-dehydrogenase
VNIAVLGLGYVGLVTSACLADMGHRVRGIEANDERLESLRSGRPPFYEPGLKTLVRNGSASGQLSFWSSADAAEIAGMSDLVVLAVGTHDGNGRWQTDAIAGVLASVVPYVANGVPIVIRSTLPPDYLQTLNGTVASIREQTALDPVPLVLNPEFTREGRAIDDFMRPDRVVVGLISDPRGIGERVLCEVYAPLGAPVLVMSGIDACFAKLASNLFLATKISFANELARLCDAHGADVSEVVTAMGYDPRIGRQFLSAGLGFGGSCLPHQVSMTVEMARRSMVDAPLLAAVEEVNLEQRARFARRLVELSTSAEPRVALLGLTFKPDTDDLRDAPSLDVARELIALGAHPVAYDPMPAARQRAARLVSGLQVVETLDEAVHDSDAIGLVTEWSEFRRIDWNAVRSVSRAVAVLDGRNALSEEAIVSAGFGYEGIGRRPFSRPLSVSDDRLPDVPAGATVPRFAA